MSFEGYYQLVCKRGHESWCAAYDPLPALCGSRLCNEPVIWSNLVDQTNGSGGGRVVLRLVESTQFEVCKCCGNTSITEAARYEIPG